MADRSTSDNFKATITDLSGSNNYVADLPAYVLDSTVRDVIEGLVTAISRSDKENVEGLKSVAEKYKEALKESDENANSNNEGLADELKKSTDVQEKIKDKLDNIRSQEKQDRKKEREQLASAIQRGATRGGRIGGDLIVSAFKGIASIFVTAGGVLLGSFTNLGNSLVNLTDTGQAFGDQLGEGTRSSTENITSLNKLGFTTSQAENALINYSRAMSTMGQSSVVGLTKGFLDITDKGGILGVTIEQASEFFLQDQQLRARTLNKDRIDQNITAQLTVKSIQNLRGFSSILGQSTEALRQQSEGILDANKSFIALTNTFDPRKATNLNAVGRSLVEGLMAVFPDAGNELGTALLTVTGTGVGAISDFANQLAPLGGQLYTSFQELATNLGSGTMTMDDVPKAVQNIVEAAADNVDQLEQLRVIAGLEGHAMQGVAQTIIQMQQDASMARDRLQGLADSTGMQYDTIQMTTVGFENIMQTLQGGYSSLLNSIPIEATKSLGDNFERFLSTLNDPRGGISVLNDALQSAGSSIGRAIGETLDALAPDGDYGKLMTDIINGLVDLTTYFIQKVENIIRALRGEDGTINFMGAIYVFFEEVIGLMLTAFVKAVGAFFTFENMGTILSIGAVYTLFVGLTASIGVMFQVMALKAGGYFRAAALSASLGGLGGVGRGLKGVGTVVKGALPVTAAIGGGLALTSDIAQGDTKGMGMGAVGAILGAGLAMALAPFTGGMSLAALGVIGAGSGYMAGSMFGGDGGEKGREVKNENRKQSQISSPSMQGPTSNSLSTRYLDSMTDVSKAGNSVLTSAEINQLDKETAETKALALILSENKRLNRQIQNLLADGIIIKDKLTRT